MPVNRIPGTLRQSLVSAEGLKLQRQYVYLPEIAWKTLQQLARESGTSVSQQIEAFAISGTVNSKAHNGTTFCTE